MCQLRGWNLLSQCFRWYGAWYIVPLWLDRHMLPQINCQLKAGTISRWHENCTPQFVHRYMYTGKVCYVRNVHPDKCTPEKCTLDIRTRKMNTREMYILNQLATICYFTYIEIELAFVTNCPICLMPMNNTNELSDHACSIRLWLYSLLIHLLGIFDKTNSWYPPRNLD